MKSANLFIDDMLVMMNADGWDEDVCIRRRSILRPTMMTWDIPEIIKMVTQKITAHLGFDPFHYITTQNKPHLFFQYSTNSTMEAIEHDAEQQVPRINGEQIY